MAQKNKEMRIGTYFVLKGLLTKKQANRILKEQQKAEEPIKPRFRSIAVKKGYLSERDADKCFLELFSEGDFRILMQSLEPCLNRF